MKHFKYFLAFAIAWMVGVFSASAYTGEPFTVTVDGVEMTFSVIHEVGDDQPATARVGTTSSNGAINSGTVGAVTIPSTVSREVNGETYTYTVITISNQAFSGCSQITQINLPSTLTEISNYAFQNCTSLETINIPIDAQILQIYNNTFYNCTSLTSISLPASVTSIASEAFRGCSSLTSINIPAGVTSIAGGAFGGCTSLSQVHITDIAAWCNIEYSALDSHPLRARYKNGGETALVLNGVTQNDLNIPEGVTAIKQWTFLYNTALQAVTIPSTMTTTGLHSNAFYYYGGEDPEDSRNLSKVTMKSKAFIEKNYDNYSYISSFFGPNITEFVIDCEPAYIGRYAFRLMSNLTTVSIPSSVTEIKDYAFDRTGLTSLTLPSGLVTIGEYAFYNCTNLTLTSDVFPSSLLTIGQYAFYNCGGLTSVKFQTGLRSIGSYAFDACGLTSITLPTPRANNSYDMTSLNTGVFSGCTALTSVTIPEGFTSIGESAFNNCWELEDVNLPSTLTTIGLHAFQDCLVLTSITIPRNVYSLRSYAFYNCPLLNDVTIQCETPPSPTTSVFRTPATGETVTLKVPMGSESSYATNYGQYFTSIIGLPMPGQVITCDDIPYTILTSPEGDIPGTVMLGTGSYNQPAYGSSASGEITVPETVTYTSGDNTYSFNVTTLGGYAFNYCNNVTRINLPATITEIQNYALSSCSSLERLYLASATPNTIIDNNAFYDANTGNCILVVPEGSKAAYQNSAWSDWFQYIKEVGHETDWLPGDVFYATIFLGLDCEKTIPFKILTPADGDTPGTVQMGIRDYNNTVPLGEEESNPSIFEKWDWCPPAITLPESVEFNNNTYTLTTLGAYVLSMMSSQYDNSKIELPSTITTIGYKAFNYSCWVNDFCVFSETAPTLIMGDDLDDDYPAPFGWSFKEATNLIVPDGCTAAYASWAPYFKNVVEKPRPVVIAGVEYKRETDIFGDGTAVISWEWDYTPKKGGYDDDEIYQYGMPVLTLNNATINYTGNGPAIEVNTFGKFYIRVKGTNTITAANGAAAISIGTNKGVDMSQTSLIFLSDDVPTDQGGGIVGPLEAPRHKARKAGAGSSNMLPSLTITNNTAGGDGIYVYQGSCNVQDCDVIVTGQKYGLEFGYAEQEEMGYAEPTSTNAPRRKAKGGPKKVTPVNGPVDADEYPGWLNIFEASGLTLNGGTAALWGAQGEYGNPGYFQNVYLQETDKSTYEADYSTIYVNYYSYYPDSSYPDDKGSYSFLMTNGDPESNAYDENDQISEGWHLEFAKYLKFGCDYFIATTEEGIRMKFKVTDEDEMTCQVGDFNEQTGPITAVDPDNTYGSVTIPEEANGYTVTSICDGAFYGCSDITDVSIPANVTSIGVMAFGDCGDLTTVTCYATTPPVLVTQTYEEDGETYTPFTGAGGKDGMILYVPANAIEAYQNSAWNTDYFEIRPIGGEGYVFAANTPEGVRLNFMVGEVNDDGAFVQVGTGNSPSVVSVPNNWDGTLTIPATVTDTQGNEYTVLAIGEYALGEQSSIKTLTLSEGIVYIGDAAFRSCNYLNSVSLPSTIEYVGSYAFYYCNSLSEVYLYNNNLENLPLLGNNSVFYSYNSAPVLFVPDDCVEAYVESNWNNYFNERIFGMSQRPFIALTPEGVALKFYTINGPDNTTWVQLGSGQGSSVVSVPNGWDGTLTVPAKVADGNGNEYNVIGIADKALYQWSGLKSVTISEGIPFIGSNTAGWGAFEDDNNLETVYLPNSIQSLADWCFSSCSNIRDVYLYATEPPSLYGNTFSSGTAILHVPYGTKADYVNSDWAQYFGYGDRIVEMEGAPTVPVTIGQYGMATFCSAQHLDFTNVAGLKAYIVSGFNDDPDNYKLTLTRVYDVKAGEGLLLIGDAGDYEIPVLQSSAQTYKNMLVGCTEDKYIKPTSTATIIKDGVTTEFTYTNFVLSKHAGDTSLGFYRFTTNNPEGRLIESGKAYLELEGDFSTSSVKGFSIVFNDDEPTAITDVEDSRGKIDDAVIYDLSGRRVSKIQKGVNIVNGKKVIVK